MPIIILLSLFAAINVSATNYWQETKQSGQDKFKLKVKPNIQIENYQVANLNYSAFQKDAIANNISEVSLPMPNGKFVEFEINEIHIMESKLAARFSTIHTYRGFSKDDHAIALILDITPKGLHAVIKSKGKSIWIDPVNRNSNSIHISYYQDDLLPSQKHWQCDFNPIKLDKSMALVNGSTLPSNELFLKTYRLAVATTGEYAIFHSSPNPANVNDTMAAIVTAMNRVNGIYETELGIRMVLVANNDQIVFTNPATDGYSNNDGFAMLGQNQTIIDNIIGSVNYDIGHVFSTGGGGVAGGSVPCNNGFKAYGVTGLSAPINDFFYIDYISHEMGHQWGAHHIFNSETGFCGNGNRWASSAVEPGSGSTILSYAGLCGADDLQNRSDAYFNTQSLQAITNFTNGAGASCALNINTNNQAPIVDAGNDYTIPKLTPFELCAQASDIDSNNLSYSWEQFDLGPSGTANSPSGNAPIFRSFIPVVNNCRIFPQLSDILTQFQTIGEVLPSYARGLTFRVTVRDNEINGGAINTDDTQLTVTDDGPFQITSHNISTGIENGSTIVLWDVANTDQAPINCSSIDAGVSLDGGINFTITTTGLSNTGSGLVNIPVTNSTQIRIKLTCANNIFFDINDADLFITNDLIFDNGFE